MQAEYVLQQLQALGTEQNRKVFRRYGVGDNFYGVSYANLEMLRKQIKIDHTLAQQLWATGNHDARILATKIADPAQMDLETINTWAADLDNHVITDAFVSLLAQTSYARSLAEAWVDNPDECLGRAGWHLVGQLAMHDPDLPDDYFDPYLDKISREIHQRKNRTREGMHNALIAIGIRDDALESKVIAVVEQIGPVYIDHGETNCKTPDPIPYIRKARARQKVRVV
jgi:3-methyladenine DNA glycosylase AlkD